MLAQGATISCLCAEDHVAIDSFESKELSSKWAAAKGQWETVNNQLKGTELASDEHAAVLTYKSPHTDSKAQLSFMLAGSKGFHLSFNHAKGHLFRVVVAEESVRINLDKDKKDPTSKPVTLTRKKATFEQGKWYTLTCQTKGEEVNVEIGEIKLKGTHKLLAKPKTGYRIVLKGTGVIFDDFKILSQSKSRKAE
jgi:hypothetical protein